MAKKKSKAPPENITPVLAAHRLAVATHEPGRTAVDDSVKAFVIPLPVVTAGRTLFSPELDARSEDPSTGMIRASATDSLKMLERARKVSHLFRLPFEKCWFEVDPEVAAARTNMRDANGVLGLRHSISVLFFEVAPTNGYRHLYAVTAGVSTIMESAGYGPEVTIPYQPCVGMVVSIGVDSDEFYIVVVDDKTGEEIPMDEFEKRYPPLSLGARETSLLYDVLLAIPVINSPAICAGFEKRAITTASSRKYGVKDNKTSNVIQLNLTREYEAQLKADEDLEETAHRTGMRAHFVRGHFKHKKNGLFWWNAHIRGVGTPEVKPYEVTR